MFNFGFVVKKFVMKLRGRVWLVKVSDVFIGGLYDRFIGFKNIYRV